MTERAYHIDQASDSFLKAAVFGATSFMVENLDPHKILAVSQNLAPAYQAAIVVAFGIFAATESLISIKHGIQAATSPRRNYDTN